MQSGVKKKLSSAAAASSSAAAGVRHGWSELPDALVVSIVARLLSLRDLLSFSSVCRSWRLVSASSFSPSPLLPPLLLRPSPLPPHLRRRNPNPNPNPNPTFHLLDPTNPSSTRRSPLSSQTLSLPFLGLSHGRLILLLSDPRRRSRRPLLADPLTGAELRAPTLPPPHLSIRFGLLTAPLSSPDSLLLLGSDAVLFQWRPGSPSWLQIPLGVASNIAHIIPSEGRVLAMDDAERLFVIHLAGDGDSRITELVVSWVGEKVAPFSLRRYLVECGGELLLVRFVPAKAMLHLGIEAFRLDRSERWRWVKMESLGDRALFIGENYRTLGFSCDSPNRWGGESNCIYYARSEDQPWSVLRLGDAVIDLSDPESRLIDGNSMLSRTPIWFYPSMFSSS